MTVSGKICKTVIGWKAFVHFRAVSAGTNYPNQPESICFQLIDGWVDFQVGNLASHPIRFTYFAVNYHPHCLWLVHYMCPASLGGALDRHAAISHITV